MAGKPNEEGVASTSWQCEAIGLRTPVQLVDANNTRHERRGVVEVAAQAEAMLSAAVTGSVLADQSAVDAALWAADGTERKSQVQCGGCNIVLRRAMFRHVVTSSPRLGSFVPS